MRRQIFTSMVVLAGLTIVLGFGYPLLVTGLASVGFNNQAGGSVIYSGRTLVGSSLVGQGFTARNGDPVLRYFQSRPSFAGAGYDASASAASNLGPSNPLVVGFVAGANSVGLDGRPSRINPFATSADPASATSEDRVTRTYAIQTPFPSGPSRTGGSTDSRWARRFLWTRSPPQGPDWIRESRW